MQGTCLYNILSEEEAQEGGKLRKVPWWGRAREAGRAPGLTMAGKIIPGGCPSIALQREALADNLFPRSSDREQERDLDQGPGPGAGGQPQFCHLPAPTLGKPFNSPSLKVLVHSL